MQDYQKDYLKSRWYNERSKIRCEFPWCYAKANDIHHLICSFRWRRKHSPDWSDLIAVCRYHHDHIHQWNRIDIRNMLLKRVQEIILKKQIGI